MRTKVIRHKHPPAIKIHKAAKTNEQLLEQIADLVAEKIKQKLDEYEARIKGKVV